MSGENQTRENGNKKWIGASILVLLLLLFVIVFNYHRTANPEQVEEKVDGDLTVKEEMQEGEEPKADGEKIQPEPREKTVITEEVRYSRERIRLPSQEPVTIVLPDGQSGYTDEYVNPVGNGHVFEYSNGDRYEGGLKDGLRNGEGILYTADGSVWRGNWKDGLLEGEGSFQSAAGFNYEGEFHQGNMDGTGTLTYADGTVYQGTFQNGVKEGTGTQNYLDSYGNLYGTYTGEYKNGQRDGQGTLTLADGSTLSGRWEQDSFVYDSVSKD